MRCPSYHYSLKPNNESLRQEYAALASLGRNVTFDGDDLPFEHFGYIKLGRQAKLHPLKYLAALAQATHQKGVGIFEETPVSALHRRGTTLVLETPIGSIEAKWVLMATHYPLPPQPSQLFFKKAAYLTYVIAADVPKNTLPEALYEDTENPYHYLRVDHGQEKDRLLLGGEDHRMDIPVSEEKCFASLKQHLQELLPNTEHTITRQWKSRIVEPGDGLAFLGPLDDDRIFYATGHSGNGLTYAVIAAELFRDFVLGRSNPLQKIYAADRALNPKAYLQSAEHYLGEFVGGAVKNIFAK
jgi:glycine/D-amino acid oxidase-like deaminating enzyme